MRFICSFKVRLFNVSVVAGVRQRACFLVFEQILYIMINIYNKINQDIVFIDAPWGGVNYKYKKTIKLYLSQKCIVKLSNLIKSKLVVLKVPINYNFNYFFNTIDSDKVLLYRLPKMYIILIDKTI